MSHPHPPAPQPGYGPAPYPHQPGYGPPPPPPKKSRTGLVLGLVIGVVLLLGAGVGVWFLLGGGPVGGKTEAFPARYEPVVEAVPGGTTFTVDKPDSYDICAELEMKALKKMLPFERGPEGGASTNGSGTGYFSCSGQMRGEIEVDDGNPTGSMNLVLEVMKNEELVGTDFDPLWESKLNRYGKALGDPEIGDAAEAKYRVENNVLGVGIAFRNGNLLGYLELGMNYGRHFEPPDKQMMVDLMTDIANSGMAALGGK